MGTFDRKYRVIRPFGGLTLSDKGRVITVVGDSRIRSLVRNRYIEPILTDADDGVNLAQLYKIGRSTANNVNLDGVNSGTIKEALKHETRQTMIDALKDALL